MPAAESDANADANADAHVNVNVAAPDATVTALLAAGLSVREVARRTGTPYSTVRNAALRLGREMTRSHPNDPSHPWARSRLGKAKKEIKEKKEGSDDGPGAP